MLTNKHHVSVKTTKKMTRQVTGHLNDQKFK